MNTDRGSRRALEELQRIGLAKLQGHGPGARWQLEGDALTAYPNLANNSAAGRGA